MYVYVCMFKMKGCAIPSLGYNVASGGPPPTSFGSPKNTWGWYISCGQVKCFSEISCLTPPKYSRVKGGYIYIYIYNHRSNATYNIHIYIYTYIYIDTRSSIKCWLKHV